MAVEAIKARSSESKNKPVMIIDRSGELGNPFVNLIHRIVNGKVPRLARV